MCPFELILVNNASTDHSARVFRQLLPRYFFACFVEEPVPGYGRAIITGLKAARGDVLSWTHADLQTEPLDVIRAFRLFLQQPDSDRVIVKGKRVGRKLGPWLFTFGMSLIASMALSGKYFDINAQPKMFSRRFFEREMDSPPEDFSLDLYLLAIAKRKHCSIRTFPVVFGKRLHGQSKWAFSFRSVSKTIFRSVKYIFQLRKKLCS